MRRIRCVTCPPTADDAAISHRLRLDHRYATADLRDFHGAREALRVHGSAVDAVVRAELEHTARERDARARRAT